MPPRRQPERADVAAALSQGKQIALVWREAPPAADTWLAAANSGALSLPFDALAGETGLWYVEGDGSGYSIARRLSIEPGFSTDDRFEVPGAYSDHRFIVEGQHFLKDGSPVRIIGERATR